MSTAQGWDAEADRRKFEEWAGCMGRGEFLKAWQMNDREGKHWPSAHQHWDRRSVEGRNVCVTALHGCGDSVQMFQYAGALAAVTSEAVYRLPAQMTRLAEHFVGAQHVIGLEAQPDPKRDWTYLEMSELPYIFRTSRESLPLQTCYLDRAGQLRGRFADRLGRKHNQLRIGVASQGGVWDQERWICYRALKPLLEIAGISVVFLQGFPADMPVCRRRTAHVLVGDLEELAGVIANLDLVISVDTLSAHLAGALGVPCWLLLKREADWRWLQQGTTSAWYPRTRLFRQTTDGDWRRPVDAVRRELTARLSPPVLMPSLRGTCDIGLSAVE